MVLVENEILLDLLDKKMIVDISPGGVVFGDLHSEGGIKILQLIGDSVYLVGEMEGGEFYINCLASERYFQRLTEIIDYKGDDDGLCAEDCPDIRHYVVASGHFVYIGRYFGAIVSRSGTKRFFEELSRINEETASVFSTLKQK